LEYPLTNPSPHHLPQEGEKLLSITLVSLFKPVKKNYQLTGFEEE